MTDRAVAGYSLLERPLAMHDAATSTTPDATPRRSPLATGAPERAPSFAEVYHTHFEFVWRTLRRHGVPAAALDDAAQEVFVAVHQALASFAARSTVRTWVYGVARRVALNHHRHVRRHGGTDVGTTDEAEVQHDAQPGPHELAERAEAARALEGVLAALEPDKREVLLLIELEEMSAPEVAEALALPVNTVYSRLRAARAEFERAAARAQRRSE